MKALARLSLLVLAALFCIAPSRGEEGGGEIGIWILPRAQAVSGLLSGSGAFLHPPRVSQTVSSEGAITLRVSSNMGTPVCSLVESASAQQLPTNISGDLVTLPAQSLGIVAQNASSYAIGTIIDQTGLGYGIAVRRVSKSQVTIEIY